MSELAYQPWEVDDFSGGMTDNYLDAAKNEFRLGDNLLIDENKKLVTRNGSEVVDPAHTLPGFTGTNPRTGAIFDFQTQIFEAQARDLYFNSGTYTRLTGPTGNNAFPAGTGASRFAFALWNNHELLTNDALGSPQKLYKDGSGVFQIRNLGLPRLSVLPSVAGSITKLLSFANDLKAKYNAHIADATEHAAADGVNTVTAADATNLATLITLVNDMLAKFTLHESDSQKSGGWSYHFAKANSSRQLASVIAPVTIADCVTRLNDIKAKFNAHDADGTAHHSPSAHQESLADGAGRTYIYSFCLAHTYTVGTTQFTVRGPTSFVQVFGIDMPSDNSVSVSGIPTLANGGTENYDTAAIKVEIYRTIDGGQSSYKVGEVTNGTATYTDTASDTTIQNTGILLYTDGGVYDAEPPPKAKYLTVANDICWYAHVQEGSQVLPTRVRQSVKFAPDACPGAFNIDMEDNIVGIGAAGIYPIVFCQKRIFRLEGFYDSAGRGQIVKREISRTVGCLSHNSIVQTHDGIFFAGTDGFYFTNGYELQRISHNIATTYSSLINTGNIYGCFEGVGKRVWWAVQQHATSPDNDSCLIAHLRFGISERMPFTTASGGDNFAPTALLVPLSDQNLYRADRRGYLFVHKATDFTDPKVDVTANANLWGTATIIYDFKAAMTHFGTRAIRKYVPLMSMYLKNRSNISVAINSYNNDSAVAAALKPVRAYSNLVWGDTHLTWGDPTLVWNQDQFIKAKRNFPAGGLRCDQKMIEFTNDFTIIENSDSLGLASIDASTKSVMLLTAPTNAWPSEAVDYYISFEADGYVANYLITARTSSALTYQDAANALITLPSTKWVIRGYRKGDVIEVLGYTLWHAFLSPSQDPYLKSSTGANA